MPHYIRAVGNKNEYEKKQHGRDENAAQNILREGLSRYSISASVEALG